MMVKVDVQKGIDNDLDNGFEMIFWDETGDLDSFSMITTLYMRAISPFFFLGMDQAYSSHRIDTRP